MTDYGDSTSSKHRSDTKGPCLRCEVIARKVMPVLREANVSEWEWKRRRAARRERGEMIAKTVVLALCIGYIVIHVIAAIAAGRIPQ